MVAQSIRKEEKCSLGLLRLKQKWECELHTLLGKKRHCDLESQCFARNQSFLILNHRASYFWPIRIRFTDWQVESSWRIKFGRMRDLRELWKHSYLDSSAVHPMWKLSLVYPFVKTNWCCYVAGGMGRWAKTYYRRKGPCSSTPKEPCISPVPSG